MTTDLRVPDESTVYRLDSALQVVALERWHELHVIATTAVEDNVQLRKIIERGRDSNATELALAAQLEEQRNGNIKLLERTSTAEAACERMKKERSIVLPAVVTEEMLEAVATVLSRYPATLIWKRWLEVLTK